jgi:hypothetical protein
MRKAQQTPRAVFPKTGSFGKTSDRQKEKSRF